MIIYCVLCLDIIGRGNGQRDLLKKHDFTARRLSGNFKGPAATRAKYLWNKQSGRKVDGKRPGALP